MRDNRAASSYPPMCQLASGIPLRPLQLYRAREPVEARDGQHVALVRQRPGYWRVSSTAVRLDGRQPVCNDLLNFWLEGPGEKSFPGCPVSSAPQKALVTMPPAILFKPRNRPAAHIVAATNLRKRLLAMITAPASSAAAIGEGPLIKARPCPRSAP
jgi:hypothetical protein